MILIGKRIKELRTKYNLTQMELAGLVGVSKATITSYENDMRQPSYDVLIKLAGVLKVSIDSLLLNRSEYIIDVSDLTPEQINRVQNYIDYLKTNDLMDVLYSDQPVDLHAVERFRERYPALFQNNDT